MKPARFSLASEPKNARGLALEVLIESRRRKKFAQDILNARLGSSGLSAVDRRLTTELVYGVLRRRGTLDALLRPLMSRQPHHVEPWIQETLRVGLYQLALLSHVPAHAAVHETVELADRFGRPRAKGFINAILRQASALLTQESASGPAADALPLTGGAYRRLTQPVLPDPLTQEYIAAGFSLPIWLVARWLGRYGWEGCLRLGFWFATSPPLSLRINPARIDRETYLAKLGEAGLPAVAGEHAQAVQLSEHVPIEQLPGYHVGWFTVQDVSAMKVGSALAPEPGSKVLDMCAAPGGKTTHLAELMNQSGHIVACDIDAGRVAGLAEQCRRVGAEIVEPRLLQGGESEPPAGPFDAVLVDVPCSNTGVLGRRAEARWRLRPDDLPRLVALQTRLLLQAVKRTKPGGRIVYSTCSIEPEENSAVMSAVLKETADFELEAQEQQIPGQPADGGYWARLRRKS
jgi:16S rRNA (cytosine967-C5)-methyltransferase